METASIISLIANALLGGGLIVTLVTLRSARKKASEEAEQVELSNADKIVKLQTDYIVNPLTRQIKSLQRNVKSLTKAIDKIASCPHSAQCPVRDELQKHPADDDADNGDGDRHPTLGD